jgi:6-phosphogluconolactonase
VKSELSVVDDVADEAIRMFLAVRPRTMVLSGGNTPEAFYRRLAGIEYEWEDVEFFYGDERCVPFEDERSNARMVEEALLSHIPARSHRMNGPECDADAYDALLDDRFDGPPRFDLAIYGLGPDGHTASLFPGRPELDVIDRWAVRVPEAGWEPFVPRITLTIPALSAARLGVFLVAGEEKRVPLRRLLDEEPIPAARLAPDGLVVIADRAAVS